MTPGNAPDGRLLDRWQKLWFDRIPPHIYALLRIVLGIIGILTLLGLHDLSAFWRLSGFVALGDGGLGLKPLLVVRGWGDIAGVLIYFGCLASLVCMTLGISSGMSVAAALTASLLQLAWNYLPLSGAHQAFQAFLFCLIWADCGAVWSVDSWRERRRSGVRTEPEPALIAPLQMMRAQVAIIYLNSGFWKLMNPDWRNGSAIHYALNGNIYQRFPGGVPFGLEGMATMLTFATLFWELSFAFFVFFRPTRRIALIVGVVMHLGMMTFLEIGPFHLVMLASYLAYLNPDDVPRFVQSVSARIRARRVVHA